MLAREVHFICGLLQSSASLSREFIPVFWVSEENEA